ncbi:MAG: AAA family ATPase [Lachnospiraceae bacterium]|nr:AAA family ATPase [Lachnospiraceae bacterium]
MIKRQVEQKILNWIDRGKNALLVSGARQVGKTFSIRRCLKATGSDYLEINLIENPGYADIFRSSQTVSDIAMELSLATGHKFLKNETILFIDEVQECTDIVTRIKFWVDEGSYRYILSGSLLGIELTNLRSSPVGYMDEIQMYPLDFLEFIIASGVNDHVISYLEEHFQERTAISDTVHEQMLGRFQKYLVTGGMPSAVDCYLNSGDHNEVTDIQSNIISLYQKDFSKYESADKKLMLQSVYQLIPSELLKQNRRYNYADIKKGLKYVRLEDSFLWLLSSGVSIAAFNATEPKIPLLANKKSSLLKLYLSDVGLLTCMYGKSLKLDILTKRKANLGGIYENYVAMELYRHGYDIYYYNSRKLGELDFVIEHRNRILPIEVKSGKDYYVHSAVNNVLASSEFETEEALVFTNYNIKKENNVFYCPVYMSTFLNDEVVLPVEAKQT